jgi:hypothetical protein
LIILVKSKLFVLNINQGSLGHKKGYE